MELYTLMVLFKDSPHNLRFFFKTNTSAGLAYNTLKKVPAIVQEFSDDYGNTASIDTTGISAVVRSFVNDDLNAQTELAMLQAHAQAKAQRRAATDPMLKTGIVSAAVPLLKQ